MEPRRSSPLPKLKTDADERRYHASMAKPCASRGALNLSQAHALAVRDCPEGCDCNGRERTREDVAEAKEIRRKRMSRGPRAAA